MESILPGVEIQRFPETPLKLRAPLELKLVKRTPRKLTCATCRFFSSETEPNGGTATLCRRYPPQHVAYLYWGRWPRVRETDWCGEHSSNPHTVSNSGPLTHSNWAN